MTLDEIKEVRIFFNKDSKIDYSIVYNNSSRLVNDETINFNGEIIVKPKIIDESGRHIVWLESFEKWDENKKEIVGSSIISHADPSNEFVIADVGVEFDSLGPISGTGKTILIDDLLNNRFKRLVVDGYEIIK